MVSWGFAFRKGLIVWLWSLLWSIVGFVIALVITGGAILSIIANPNGFANNPGGTIVALFSGVAIGVTLSNIGLYATIVKTAVEASHEQPPMPPAMPSQRQP